MDETPFRTAEAGSAPVVAAPDGATVRPLLSLDGLGSQALFELSPGSVTRAVSHATVQELWYVTAGRGRIWRRQSGRESVDVLREGTSVSVPLGTAFQFLADPDSPGPLRIVAITMPPWPDGSTTEARPEDGPWPPTVG
ncbi:cupin domain-containing protein [Kitasatospora purpeofusca]|uniref:cupin domain-containing protein n=1 Tax=Kitasatospora purpeofusca TaxID=67352 RepID=UPI00369CC29A|nr:hypothetical protein KPHV_16640 [Kitasatospora purpeofusca]